MRRKKLILQIISFIGFLIIVGGIGVGVYLSQSSQDTRQKASEQGIVELSISPNGSTYTSTQEAAVQLQIDSGPNVVKVEKLDFTLATVTGDVPSDLSFSLAPLPGVIKVTTTLVDVANGKEVHAVLTNPSNSYTTNGASLPLGTFRFTPKDKGSMTITLHPSMSDAIKGVAGNETIRLPGSATFVFSVPTPTPAPTIAATPTPTAAARAQTSVTTTITPETKTGSVTVCAVISMNNTVLTDWTDLEPETIQIEMGSNPPVSGTTGDGKATNYGTSTEVLSFSTQSSISKPAVLGVNGVCKKITTPVSFTVGQQPATHITYKAITLDSSSQFETVTYNDQWTSTSSLASAKTYTTALFDKDTSNDATRSFSSDGDIPINDAKPDRVLTFVLTKSAPQTQAARTTTLLTQSAATATPDPTAIPTVEPTTTPSPTTSSQSTIQSATATPTPTLLAQVSTTQTSVVPATQLQPTTQSTNQELPVSGNESYTIILLGFALLSIGLGIYNFL